jgi:LPXTG-motif cell wall-anchored protein
MDDLLYAEPGRTVAEPPSLALLGLGLLGALGWFARRQRA